MSIVLFGVAFEIVGIHEWGLEFDFWHQSIGKEAKASGRYLAGTQPIVLY